MEENPESGKQTTEMGPAESGWVLPPTLPSGTSIEISTLTKADQTTPEMLELLQQLMVLVQSETHGEEVKLEACGALTDCGGYTAPSCGTLTGCGTFTKPTTPT